MSATLKTMPMTKVTLRELAEERGFSAADIARSLGVSPQAVGFWLRGQNGLRVGSRKQLADLLGVSVREVREASEESRRIWREQNQAG